MVGTDILHYRVLSKIGQGGMGEVYLALDTTLGRNVALKFLPPTQAFDEAARKRLLREAQAAAHLDHPFICKVYEVAEHERQPFIAMEFVDGPTLRDRLAVHALTPAEAIRAALEIADAIEFAHKKGVVHRDLKPSNIMLTADGHAKVMDFGLAKREDAGIVADGASTVAVSATSTGSLTGTLVYMSPEQLRGLPADERSDIFAFGLVLYEMLTGGHPFRRSTPIATTAAILNEPESPIDRYVKDAPPLLAHVVARTLAKDPDQRYQSLREARIELSTLVGSADASSRRVPLPSNRRRGWAAAAAIAVALTAGAAAIRYWPRSVPATRALAFKERDWILIGDFENLTADPVFDRSLRVALEVSIAQSKFINVYPSARVQDTLRRMQKSSVERVDEATASEVAVREGLKAVLVGSVAQVGDVYSITSRLIDPRTRQSVATDLIEARGKDQVLPALNALTARVRASLGESLKNISQQNVPLPRATTSSLEALKMYADSFKPGMRDEAGDQLLRQAIAIDPEFALAHAELGQRYYLQSSRAVRIQGEEHVAKALGLLDRLSAREQLWIRASAEDSRGNRRAAVDAYETYLAQYPDDGRGWFRLGWTEMAGLGQLPRAIEAFKRAIALNERSAAAHVNLATCYSGQARFREAVDEYEKAFALSPELMTGTYVNHEFGFTLVQLGEVDRAADVFKKVIAGPDDGGKARGHRSLGLLRMYQGRYADAAAELHQTILINHAAGNGLSEFRDRLFLARAFEARGMKPAMTAELKTAGGIASGMSLAPSWLSILAKLDARTGDVEAAKKLLALMVKTAADPTADSSVSRDMDRDRANLDLVRGELALAEGKVDAATALFEAARAVDPRDTDILESVAAGAFVSKRWQDAAKYYEELIARRRIGDEAQEHWLRSHVVLGEVYGRLGRAADERRMYERLLTIWKDGDPDVAALQQAKTRLTALDRAGRR